MTRLTHSSSAKAAANYGQGVVTLEDPEAPPAAVPPELLRQVSELLNAELSRSEYQQPLLPTTAVAALKLANSPRSGLREVCGVMVSDPGLAATVLRAANTPQFAGSRPADTLRMALGRVGLVRLRELLLVASAGRVLRVPHDREFGDRLRQRSLQTGRVAKLVAKICTIDGGPAFTAGLLHDVGLAAFHTLYPRILSDGPPELASIPGIREDLAEALHEELGAAIAMGWKLPAPVIGAMGYHHHPDLAIVGLRMAWLVAAASDLVAAGAQGRPILEGGVESEALSRLGVSWDQQQRLERAAHAIVEESSTP